MNDLPDTISELNDEITCLENAFFATGRHGDKLKAARKKRDRLKLEQIRQGTRHEGFERPVPA